MRGGLGFLVTTVIVLGLSLAGQAYAQTATPPANNPPANNPPAASTTTTPTTPKCALDEFPATENGTTTCKKVPSCTKNEVISYDTATQKFACKKLVQCDPKTQQAAYINGKNVCIDVPNCERQGKHYAFDGSKMVCE